MTVESRFYFLLPMQLCYFTPYLSNLPIVVPISFSQRGSKTWDPILEVLYGYLRTSSSNKSSVFQRNRHISKKCFARAITVPATTTEIVLLSSVIVVTSISSEIPIQGHTESHYSCGDHIRTNTFRTQE